MRFIASGFIEVSQKESEKQQLYFVAYDVPKKMRFSDRYKVFLTGVKL
ncbi:hypothetical protein [Nostoc sp. NZL]|nr:hypothetical protein [Nostoc sp. NZL]